MMAKLPLTVVFVTSLLVAGVTAFGWSSSRSTVPPSAKALEATLLAPCCWNGTLATHDSPVATELRDEIESRSAKGETTVAIEGDLVSRYGEKIRAMPSAGAFTNAVVIALDLLIITMAGLAILLFRWRRNSTHAAPSRSKSTAAAAATTAANAATKRDAYDDRIDADLAELES